MANKSDEKEGLWGGVDRLHQTVKQLDHDVIQLKARVKSLEADTSLTALVKANRRIAVAAEKIADVFAGGLTAEATDRMMLALSDLENTIARPTGQKGEPNG